MELQLLAERNRLVVGELDDNLDDSSGNIESLLIRIEELDWKLVNIILDLDILVPKLEVVIPIIEDPEVGGGCIAKWDYW